MIASALGLLVGMWDGFAAVFYDHRHPMSRSYALGHAAGRWLGAIRLTRGAADEALQAHTTHQPPRPHPRAVTPPGYC